MRFKKIITLSLNPVLDITFRLDSFEIGAENIVVEELYDSAGKAVNVSRVLQSYEIDNTSLIVAGKENSVRYFERLAEENIKTQVIYTEGRIRENISMVLPNGSVTRFMRNGFTLKSKTLNELEGLLSSEVINDTLVVFAGKVPDGVDMEFVCILCEFIQSKGGVIALDTGSLTLKEIQRIKPWVIKPNYKEFCDLLGTSPESLEEIKQGAMKIHDIGVEHVLVSLGADGMLYTNGAITIKADVPDLDTKSTVGAGDAALGGFIVANDYEYAPHKAIQLSAAFGTASCLTEGTNPPRRISVAMVVNQIKTYEI